MSTAGDLRSQGNQYFVAKDYPNAIRLYSQAIDQNASDPVLYSNRAQCYINTLKWPEARLDIDLGLLLSPETKVKVKLLFRRSVVLSSGFDDDKGAKLALLELLSLDPSNSAARNALEQLKSPDRKKRRKEIVSEPADFVEIPIDVVDTLPQEFLQKLTSANEPKTESTVPRPSSNVDSIAEELFSTRKSRKSPDRGIIPTVPLIPPQSSKISVKDPNRIPQSELEDYFSHVLKIGDSQLKGNYFNNLDPNFLQVFLQASNHFLSQGSNSSILENIEHKILLLSKFGRFSLALLLCDTEISKKFSKLIKEHDLDFSRTHIDVFGI